MKRITYIFFITLTFGLCSCSNDSDDIFGATASDRIEESLADFRFALRSRGQWVIEYFPGYDKDFGGWIYVVEFRDNNTLKAWFEGSTFVKADEPVTESDYAVRFSTGTMLTFNTFNDYLHYFDYPGTNGGYQGYEGDHEFTLMSVSPAYDEIVMRALKTWNTIRMTPLPEGYTPELYVNNVRQAQKDLTRKTLTVTANGKPVATLERSRTMNENNFGDYKESKVWTISYKCRKQVKDVSGNPVIGPDSEPVYENLVVQDKISMIVFADGSMKFYEPYMFKGEVLNGDEVVDFVSGETMRTFKRHLGLSHTSDYYSCTDSFVDFRLVP